jgi:hypothetical protein
MDRKVTICLASAGRVFFIQSSSCDRPLHWMLMLTLHSQATRGSKVWF